MRAIPRRPPDVESVWVDVGQADRTGSRRCQLLGEIIGQTPQTSVSLQRLMTFGFRHRQQSCAVAREVAQCPPAPAGKQGILRGRFAALVWAEAQQRIVLRFTGWMTV
jgi:hypothetical protein